MLRRANGNAAEPPVLAIRIPPTADGDFEKQRMCPSSIGFGNPSGVAGFPTGTYFLAWALVPCFQMQWGRRGIKSPAARTDHFQLPVPKNYLAHCWCQASHVD